MKFRVLGCSGGSIKDRFLSCYLLNDEIALDAGGLTGPLTLEEQLAVRHVIVTHTHMDHNCGLPFYVDNVFGKLDEPVLVYGTKHVIDSLAAHMFNDELWPDFTKLPTADAPTMRFVNIEPDEPFSISGLRFTPIPVDHLTPTVGFLIEDNGGAIIYTSDTGPTERVWEVASSVKELKCLITEASFSNDDDELARVSGHMTPRILAGELKKVRRDVPVPILVTHVKPGHRLRIEEELRAENLENVELLEDGRTYRF
jgi:ribonuclease BN (tRNA processing enzyme)